MPSVASAQIPPLTPDQLAKAITRGLHGYTINPNLDNVYVWMLGDKLLVSMDTPFTRVSFAAAAAKKAGRGFEPSEVTAEMRRPTVRVDVLATATFRNMGRPTAILIAPFGEPHPSATAVIRPVRFEAKPAEKTLWAEFPVTAIKAGREFRITVSRNEGEPIDLHIEFDADVLPRVRIIEEGQ